MVHLCVAGHEALFERAVVEGPPLWQPWGCLWGVKGCEGCCAVACYAPPPPPSAVLSGRSHGTVHVQTIRLATKDVDIYAKG